mmetsp:Transcript_2373/g.4413  ORF Transcript_2373/g.4413 Transcript_2373/m.4413 type:complete len:735 (+) Transcript_2373:200-2404(+)|eukprot:CAMPEP_0196142136 /NCGR_PEP_ID=MMETSP0910-20130528/11150_1 /TAXON_ID=49265 /ORGANISM="Thalassiosira rotula, Strain GSO102" /LENGTH=734 /DNA_ID=CAMNT_0041403411 /DNA_START=163 /DNA_END=2367 /DNA_ORIENTATION=-
MASLDPSGMVLNADQIRDERRRRGFCDSCGIEPNRCFEIKKRMTIFRDRIPLTIPGKVYNGICLSCNPDSDPTGDAGKHKRKKTQRRSRKRNTTEEAPKLPLSAYGHSEHEDTPRRTLSSPMVLVGGPVRQAGFRNLGLNNSQAQGNDRDYALSLPSALESQRSDSQIQSLDEAFNDSEQVPKEKEYVEEMTYNIFNEPVLVRKRKSRSRSLKSNNGGSGGNSFESPPKSRAEEKSDEEPAHLSFPPSPPHQLSGSDLHNNYHNNSPPQNSSPYRQNSGRYNSPPHDSSRSERDSHPSLPSLFGNRKNSGAPNDDEDEPQDALAALCAQYVANNPEEPVKFVPNSEVIPGSELHLPDMSDELSVMTPDTFFRGSLASMMSKQQSRRTTHMSAISEGDLESRSTVQQRSMVSHLIREPAVPVQAARQAGIPFDQVSHEPAAASAGRSNTQDMESYLESFTPHLLTLREIVGQCTMAGCDPEAIDTITQALIHDNATCMSMDLALFCMTTLWILARKSDENKHKIIFEESTFDAIVEAMQIYRERSAEIQNRACGVLWSLSMDPNDRKHVAQAGGCDAILNAMLVHSDDDALQVMALGALKVLSFDNIAKSTMRSLGTLTHVANVMQNHLKNPTIQSEGCVILGNLAASVDTSFVAPVGEREVDAVINGILNHPDSLEVHEAACFTLMCLASLASNVELIRSNINTRVALELACQKHRDEVGNDIFILLRRLELDP